MPLRDGDFAIEPVRPSDLGEVAVFLLKWHADRDTPARDRDLARETPAGVERRLRWLLLENPVASGNSPLGFCLRDNLGIIRGLTLCFPAAFSFNGQRLLGLGSGCFFVEPPARSLGFFLFKKYLSVPGHSFFFSTTCNAASGELWSKLGARAIPGSDTEHLIPLRVDRLGCAFLAHRKFNTAAEGIVRFIGRCANPILRYLRRLEPALAIQPCQDWERLSKLASLHGCRQIVASERSAAFLRWRYGPGSPLHPCDIYVFKDQRGNEGWFALGNLIRGVEVQIRGCYLLDAVWPRENIPFGSILAAIVRLASPEADAILFRSQPGLEYRDYSRWVVPYKLAAPRAFVKFPKNCPAPPLDALDYEDNDFGAFMHHWSGRHASEAVCPREAASIPRTALKQWRLLSYK